MSIEALLTELAAAVRTNTEAVHLLTQSLAGRTPSNAKEPKAEEPKAEEPKAEEPKAEEPKAEEPKAEEPKAEEPKAEEPKADDVTPVAYGTVRELVVKLAPSNRDAIKAIIEKHKLGKLPELLKDDKDFDSVTDQAKLESIYAALRELEV